ncbi:hypothetical protein IRJ41_012202 [Triplophysa rosa]|uniref:Saposin B-type domain-containing protein n=1 Tax=Triplophysa rosa TaxID=992332 RepID=A0A9W7WLU7_TRIRA|nr:hypothetical protein IRJ41_012202 [Triplophysa rosa]
MIASLAFLITLSVMAKCESNSDWLEPQMSSQSEMYSLMDRYRDDILSIRPNIIFCCVCQELIRRAKTEIYNTIQKKINSVCNKYIKAFRKVCLQRATRYRDILLHKLFPGGSPRGTCMKIKFCS